MDWSLRKYAKADAITSSLENTAGTAVVKVNSRVRQVTVSYALPLFRSFLGFLLVYCFIIAHGFRETSSSKFYRFQSSFRIVESNFISFYFFSRFIDGY